jgi:hypothetical protein
VRILASPAREILTIETSRCNAAAQGLAGFCAGGRLRGEIARRLPEEHAAGTPLHFLLDDFTGAIFVAGWPWSRWRPDDWLDLLGGPAQAGASLRDERMEGVCSGFRPGSSALTPEGTTRYDIQSSARVPSLVRSDDPQGWHKIPRQEGVGMRRARRIDVWLEEVIHADIGFQDSGTTPDGGDRMGIHEYHLTATVHPETRELLSVQADPRVLPYVECPGAVPNLARLLGRDVAGFRREAPATLPGALGCTHLNEVLRTLADIPRLAASLREALNQPAA